MTNNIGDLYIPFELANDRNVVWGAKCLYSVIRSLITSSQRQDIDYCYASNDWYATTFDVSERTVSNWLQQLDENGYIVRRTETYNGTQQRRVYLASIFTKKQNGNKADIFLREGTKKIATPPRKNLRPQDNSINNNKSRDNTPLTPLQQRCEVKEESRTIQLPTTTTTSMSAKVLKPRKGRLRNRTAETWRAQDCEPYGRYKNIWLTKDQYKNLAEEWPIQFVNNVLDQLSTYMQGIDKDYYDHYAIVQSWAIKKSFNNQKSNTSFNNINEHEYSAEELRNLFDDIDEMINNI